MNEIRKTVEDLPEVKKYYERENAVKGPFLPSYAQLKFWKNKIMKIVV